MKRRIKRGRRRRRRRRMKRRIKRGRRRRFVCSFVRLFGFLTSSLTTRLYHGRAPRQSV